MIEFFQDHSAKKWKMGYELGLVCFLSLYSFHYSQYSRMDRIAKFCFVETEDTVGLTNEYV